MAWLMNNNHSFVDTTNKPNTVGSMSGIFFASEEKTNDIPIMRSPVSSSSFQVVLPSTSLSSVMTKTNNISLSLFDNDNPSTNGAPASVLSQVIIDMFAGTPLSPIAEISTKSGRNNTAVKTVGSSSTSAIVATLREREREKPRGFIFTSSATSPISSPIKSESKTSSLEESNYENIIEKYNKRIMEVSNTTVTSTNPSSLLSSSSSHCNPVIPRPDAIRTVLLEMDAEGICPNIDTAILAVMAFDLAGLGGRTLDVIGTIAQIMLNSGANPVQVRDVVLHPRTVAVMLTATACEGQGTMVRNLWTAYTRAAETRRKSSSMLNDLMNGTGYDTTTIGKNQHNKDEESHSIDGSSSTLPSKDAGTADKQCLYQLRGLYAMSLAIALCRISSSCLVVHSNHNFTSTTVTNNSSSPSTSFSRINTQLPPSDTLMALHNLLKDCGITMSPDNMYSLDKSSNTENNLSTTIPTTIGAALAIAYRMAGYRIQARKILSSIVQAYASHTASDTPPYLDSQSFPSLVIALGVCNLSNDLRALMVQASARAISSGSKDHGPLGSPLMSGSGASTMVAWLAGHIIRTDDTAVVNVWKQLTTSPAMQRMKLLQNIHIHNVTGTSTDSTIHSSPSELASIPVASIANILVPSYLQKRETTDHGPTSIAKLPFTTLATGLAVSSSEIATIASSKSLSINSKYSFDNNDECNSIEGKNDSKSLSSSSQPVSWIAANMRVSYQVSVGKLRDALVDYLPALPASSKHASSSSAALQALYMPLPETVTLLLHAICADIGPEGKSLSGLRLPQYLVAGLASTDTSTFASDNGTELTDGNILFEDGNQYVALIQAVLAAARAWGLRPRLTDMAAVIEIHGVIGNLRLALGDIRSSPGGPSSIFYAALVRGITRWGAVTFMEAEWVARRAHEDNVDISNASLAAAVDGLSTRLGADMHPVYRTNKSIGQAASTVIQALAPTALQNARENASPLTTSIALSAPYIPNTSIALASTYILSHYVLLNLSDLYVDPTIRSSTNTNTGANSNEFSGNSIGTLPSNAVSIMGTLARSVAEALLSSSNANGTVLLQENAISTQVTVQEQVPVSTNRSLTSPNRENFLNASSLRIPDLVDEGHLSAAERNSARNNSSNVPNGFAVFSRGTNNGTTGSDNLPSMIIPGAWKSKTNSVPVTTVSKSSVSATPSSTGTTVPPLSTKSAAVPNTVSSKSSSLLTDAQGSNGKYSIQSSNTSSVTVSSLLRKDCWDYRTLGYSNIAGDLMTHTSSLPSVPVPDFGQLVMAIATPAPTFEGAVRALKRAERSLGRSHSMGKSFQADQPLTAVEHRAAMDALPIAAAILRAERAAAINAGRVPVSPERKSGSNKMDEEILSSTFSTDPDMEMSPDTVLLEETCREAHADTARLESELHSVAAQLSAAEASLNSFVHIQWDMATIARALTGHIGTAASTGVKPSAAMLYTSRGTNAQLLAIEDTQSSSLDGLTPLGPIKARTVLRKREAALRGAIARLRSEEEALLNVMKEGGGGVAADIYRSHNESMNNMLSACTALETKIEQDDRKVIAFEDAMLSSRDGLRAWAGIGNRSGLSGKDANGNDTKTNNNAEEETVATAMDAIAQLSSSLLTQAARQSRTSRSRVRSVLDSQIIRAQGSVAAVEELAHSQTALNSRLRALVSSFHHEIDRMTSLLEEETGFEDGLRLAITQLTMKRDQVVRKHEQEAERVEEAISRMRATLARELSRRVDSAHTDVSRAMEAAATKGRMSAAVEGAAALEAVRHATELAVAKASQDAAEAISPTVHEQLKAGIRSNMRLEEAIETALAATAGDAGRRRELHARIAAETSLLQAAEVALLRARTEADHIVAVDGNLRSLRTGQKDPPVSEIKVPALTSVNNKGVAFGTSNTSDEFPIINTAGMSASAQLWSHATNLGLTAFDLCGTVEEAVSAIVPIIGSVGSSSTLSGTGTNNNTLENLAYGITLGPETDAETASAAIFSLDSIINLYEEELAKVRVRSLPSVANTTNHGTMGNTLPLPPDPTRAAVGLTGKRIRTNNDNVTVPAISVLDAVIGSTPSSILSATPTMTNNRYNPSLLPSRAPPSVPIGNGTSTSSNTVSATKSYSNPSSLAIEALANTSLVNNSNNMAAIMQVYGIKQ